ncbi:MAG TPA: di-heme enzyme, partial [Candidatus Polarisedimenticolia bacterium]|nr:di-heme enzyme [Candidatus Polarisedimenticolia bacterium]
PEGNFGLFEYTGRPADMGRFRAPTLRNAELTAPYMHDGSIPTLREVIETYAQGGRTIAAGPLAGVGRESPWKSHLVAGFVLDERGETDLIEFLNSLTDRAFITDPRFSPPSP